MRLDEIVARLGGELRGDGSVVISQVGTLAGAGAGQIGFLANPKYRKQLAATRASAVIVPPQAADDTSLPRIVFANSYAYYARVAALLNPPALPASGIHPSAVVASTVPGSVSIGANVVVGEGVSLGENVVLFPGVVIGDGVSIGSGTRIYPNVVIYRNCVVGERVVIQAGAIIGSDGFGYAKDDGRWLKIPQIGRVVIGNDVEIGANTTIDRGALEDTIIGNGVILDNQIQIAHNCTIGEQTAMAGCVGVAGSTHIGARCTVGGAGMIIGHLEIADDVHISAGTMVTKNLKRPGQYTSIYPLEAHEDWLQNAAQLKRLARLSERVSQLEKFLDKKLEQTDETD
ncbi:MAG TPA: UDP-3-O-(3-hydroxymyristoyl)glucosamine N-acyltransferase [Azospira sp.]|nr:UDP-3-O-(3-hydroxymyristoyl)glucosamine N-acyltransferase [Azospira sp.]HNN08280.1 UDP-3-O-(3-hydroxymyristoyl)glucosamine N-acyltransferase [Azospira sp.]HNN45167.1 UDP-3-O-(3-hydroxymyristoyl)glucosamine N-acyltransferase [Azospira sp.]